MKGSNTVEKVKRALKEILYFVCGIISSCILPFSLIIAFNYSKGIAYNNLEGVSFMPFGAIIAACIIISYVVLIIKTAVSKKRSVSEKISVIGLFILSVTAGTVLSVSAWKWFLYCLNYSIF